MTLFCTTKDDVANTTSGLKIFEHIFNNSSFFEWIHENKAVLEQDILTYGGILLRNCPIYSLSEFSQVVDILCPSRLDYVFRSTPRTHLGNKLYTATEYPADRTIQLHNENSYSRTWPHRIIFFSSIVSETGGETPVADSRKVYQKINPVVRDKFEKLGVLYVRNFKAGIDLSWQEVFQTDNKLDVEDYCSKNEIEIKWHDSTLTTRQICQATTIHPTTGEKVWFNQAHLFHPSALNSKMLEYLVGELGEANLPRNAFFGDETPIDPDFLSHIRDVYKQEKIVFKWQKRDIMILDNLLMAHGREPYQGERKVVVAMS